MLINIDIRIENLNIETWDEVNKVISAIPNVAYYTVEYGFGPIPPKGTLTTIDIDKEYANVF